MVNLLPPSHKEELRGEEQFRLALILGLLLVAFFVCLSLSLLSIRVYVSGEIQAQQILVESQREEGGESRVEQIRQRNADIAGISSFYTGRIALSDIIARISDSLPEGVSLSAFTYAPILQSGKGGEGGLAKAKVLLVGFAPLTEDLLSMRANLEEEPLFGNFHFPPSNWIRASNIDFSFDFEI